MRFVFPALIAVALLIPTSAEACPLGRVLKAIGGKVVGAAKFVNQRRPKLLPRNR